ncbi:hypothetical protein LCGC14_1479610, partial [marine sediment metagenome]
MGTGSWLTGRAGAIAASTGRCSSPSL